MTRAQTIQIYLPLGDPAGIRVASLTTRTVQMFEVPRPLLNEFLAMPKSSQVGVYFLFGVDDDKVPQCYIGQSGSVGDRLKQHAKDASKDFWTIAAIGVSLTNEWTSTHAAQLEWTSIDESTKIDRYNLVNGNSGNRPHTPDPLKADCSEFFETMAVLLSTLGHPLLKPISRSQVSPKGEGNEPEKLFFRESGCKGVGVQTPEGFLILEGSTGRAEVRPSATPSEKQLRAALLRDKVVEQRAGVLVFLEDHLFSSPSGAAGALVGGGQNGRTGWRNAAGKNLHQIEAEALDAVGTAAEA